MSYYNDFLKELKKRELTIDDITVGRNADSKSSDGRTVSIGNSSFANEFKSELAKRGLTIADVMEKEEEIAPIRTRVSSKDDDEIAPVRKDKEEEEERTWFQRGAFEDGFSLKNLGKAILGSAEDVIENVGTGIVGMGEKLVDSIVHLAPYYSQSQFYQNGGSFLSEDMQKKQNEAFEVGKKSAAEFIQKDLYDEEKVVKQIYTNNTISKQLLNADPDDISVFGEKSDALAQSAGQLAATAALSAAGVPWFLTTGVTSYGGEVENALKQGATMEEAGLSGLISAGAEILTEKISGGIKFGGKTLDDALVKEIARGVSNKTVRTLLKLGLDATGEGFEEVLSGAISAVGQKISYADDKELNELFSKEDAWESFIGGAVLGGGSSVIGAVKSAKNGVDPVSGLTKNEQKVVDKEYKERVEEAEKQGKVSQSEKSKIYDQVLEEMEKGYISTDSIEAALGGETYKVYHDTVKSEDDLQKEFDTLNKMKQGEMTGEQIDRRTELKEKLADIKQNSKHNELKTKLSEEVKSLVAGDRLAESYNERSRRQQAFEADLSQYDEKQQAVVKKAVESGILNNTNRTHEFVDMVAKISADKGVLFDFTNNAKLKESGFSLDGASVNGYKTSDGIVVNVDSAKSRSFVVGHEVTHVLEGTELYSELQKAVFDYAKMKGEYDSRLASVTELYKKYDPEADPAKELTSDLVGEYLFSDPEFVNNLSTEHRNVFQKVYDEIKYMLKVATAGSKEARELERVKKIFEQAYRAETKNTADGGVNHSLDIKHSDGTVEQLADARSLTTEQAVDYLYKAKSGELRRDTYVPVRKDTPQVLIDTLEQVNDHIENLSMVMNVDKAQQAMNVKNPGTKTKKYGDNVRKHGLSPEEVVEIINNLDNPNTVIYQTNRFDKKGNALPNSVAVFVEYKVNGNEGMAAVEFENPRNTDTIGTEFGETNYHTVITVFEPDVERDGMPFDYVEELLSNPDNYELEIKRRQDDESATGEKHPNTSSELPSSAVNIADNQGNVKRQFSLSDTTGRQISKEQAEYFKDSKVRDENGNLKVMYHGTPNGEFTVFKDGTYFTDNKEYADRYQNPGASSISSGKTASNPKTFEVYLDIKKPFDLSNPEAKRIYIEDYIKGGNAMGINPYLSDAEYAKIKTIDWTEGEDLRDFLTENGYDYDGLVLDEGADGGYGDEVKSRGTSYVVFSPEQVKNIDNAKPTTNPEIQKSISNDIAPQRPVSDPLTDLRLEGQEDIAPVVENATTEATVSNVESVADMFPDDTAPIQEEYENLLAEREDIKGAMDAYAAVGNYDGAEQLMAEYEAVQARIAEIEADDADRFASIDDADAPQEVDNSNPEDVADNVPLTKVLVNNLAKQVKSQLGLGNNRTAEVRELIERYSNEEFPSKAHLYTEIAERFGTITETEVDEDLKGIKSLLRTYGINVDDSIKSEIPDYAQLMRSNFGKVRFSKEGLPVDVAYKEFQEALPGYFPESIYVPTDQLMRIIEVANMDTTMETEYEIDWQTLEEVTDTIMNGVAEFKQNRKETLANKHGRESFRSLMEDADQYVPPIPENVAPASYSIAEDTAPVRPAIESVQAEPDDIAPVFETSSGQQAILPEVEVPKKVTRSDLHYGIMDNIKTYFKNKGFDFDKVLKDAKDLSTFATVDNTPQRVLEKALGYKEGQMLSEMTVNRVARNETEGIKWLNSFTDKKSGLLVKISKQYGIKPGSKASAAAQMYAEGFYVGENDAIIAYGDKELAADFPNKKVQDNIKKLARDPRIRQIYDETLAAINKSRTRNAYPEIPRLDNYFLHFRAMEDTFSRIGLPFNPNDIRAKDLPTDLNGVTADLKPGQPYFASAKHRTGKRTSFDLLGGLEKYLTSAKNQIYHIDDIQTFRALRNYVAETYGQATGLQDLDLLSDEEAEQRIKDVYDAHLSTFAKFLNEEANVLAGKTSLIDRGLEGVIGRRGITFLDTLNRQVGANMVGFNVSSSLTNFLAPVQAFAKSNKFDFVKAMAQTAYNKMANVVGKGDNFAEESPVMIRRKGAERFYRTPYQQVADKGYILMGVVDDISTELIARTKYNELTRKGMSSNQAHYETDKWVSRLMGDRSLGQQPQLYNSKMLGLFTKFQLEVRNQLDSQFYDTIQEAKVSTEEIENGLLRNAKKAAKITSTFAQLAVMQHLFGKAFESVAGYNPAFDIIEALIKTFGWDDDEESEDTVLDNIEEGFLTLLEDLPYTSTLTGGRIPIASALPVTQFIKGEDQYGNEKNRWQTLGEAAPYYVLPGGYGQIKKTKAGLEMFDEDLPIAGSYTDSGGLRFPVEDTIGNRVQAGLFGQWASENARDYFDNERKPLKEKQIQELIDTEMPIKDYWDYREGLAEHEKLEDKIDYIAGLDLPISTKNILVNNVTDRKNPIDLTNYDEFATYEEFDFASKNPEKYEFLEANNISYAAYTISDGAKETYDAVYEWVNNYPDKVTVSKAVTDNVVAYRRYAKDLNAIRADKDSNGKSISGSAKEKKWNYIDGLDIDYGAKLILFKNEYNADDTYNYEIIDYLNGRDDISFDEMNTILKELGFNVTADGTITW